jgi:hypothetical protein
MAKDTIPAASSEAQPEPAPLPTVGLGALRTAFASVKGAKLERSDSFVVATLSDTKRIAHAVDADTSADQAEEKVLRSALAISGVKLGA